MKVSYVAMTATMTATNQMQPGTLQMMLQTYGMGGRVPLPGCMGRMISILFKHLGYLMTWTHRHDYLVVYYIFAEYMSNCALMIKK